MVRKEIKNTEIIARRRWITGKERIKIQDTEKMERRGKGGYKIYRHTNNGK